MNLTELLDETARVRPEKAAIIEDTRIVSYAQLSEMSEVWAGRFRALQFKPGCRVGLSFPNGIEYVALTFALWRVGAVVVPIPEECPPAEAREIARSMELQFVLSRAPTSFGTPEQKWPECFFTRLEITTDPDNHGLNLAFVRFTSGTTNVRKGVALCHESIRDRIRVANSAFRIGPEDTVMWCLPMAHHFLITIVLYVWQGATIVLARHIAAKPFLDAVNRWRGTVLYAAPFHYALLARDKSGMNIESVRLAVSTTCALPRDVADAFFARFGRRLRSALGVIELGLVSMNSDDENSRWDSVGRPVDGLQVRIVEPDTEGFGDVAVSGPGFFDAYAAPWVSRESIQRDGWFHTGDIGRIDAGGFLFLAGRKTAVINLAGRKVFPEEVENVLNQHPAVRESRAFGRSHPHLGEVVEAEVVLADGGANPDDIIAFCGKSLASFKIPSRLHIVSALPRTAVTGKIIRASTGNPT